jgi:hypothetical protein
MGLNVLCPFSEFNEMFNDCQFVPTMYRAFLNLIPSFYNKKNVFCHIDSMRDKVKILLFV